MTREDDKQKLRRILEDRVADRETIMTEPLMTVAELAERWRISAMTIYRLIHAGELKALRFGRSYRVPRTAVTTYELRQVAARYGGENGLEG